ncbi:acetylserotonin O-methyltransferase [Amycolatopsis anabasis]|uniref:acetylserotonin O-methyltransferase n=1 Tax=Amycolatopsis anabasis TaxID=1840409 RepID=UPI001FEAA435|nr:acetylserotonin O-methyltransferase [Amycolatopsis anabasis]
MNESAAANPAPILHAATGFMAAKQLFTAAEVGLFAAIEDEPVTAGELAERTGLPERSARILADAMVGLRLLTWADGRYRNSEAAAAYLSGRGEGPDLRRFLTFWDQLSYPHWESYADSARSAGPAPFALDGDRMDVFLGGVQTYNSLHALLLAEHYDFGRHRRMLDLAGLTPAFLTEAVARHPGLGGVFAATGDLLDAARNAASPELRDRIEFHDLDVLTDPVPGRYDVVLLEHVVHRYHAGENRVILGKAREVAEAGARLLVLDFLLEPAEGRRLDALFAGEYLVVDGTVVYPESEVRDWLAETGWRWLETRALPGSPRVVIAEAA